MEIFGWGIGICTLKRFCGQIINLGIMPVLRLHGHPVGPRYLLVDPRWNVIVDMVCARKVFVENQESTSTILNLAVEWRLAQHKQIITSSTRKYTDQQIEDAKEKICNRLYCCSIVVDVVFIRGAIYGFGSLSVQGVRPSCDAITLREKQSMYNLVLDYR